MYVYMYEVHVERIRNVPQRVFGSDKHCFNAIRLDMPTTCYNAGGGAVYWAYTKHYMRTLDLANVWVVGWRYTAAQGGSIIISKKRGGYPCRSHVGSLLKASNSNPLKNMLSLNPNGIFC